MLNRGTGTKHNFSRQAGLTLIEMMMAILISTVVVAAGFAILTSTSKAVRANNQTVDLQQNIRMAMILIEHDIKDAGFGMTGQVGNCAAGGIASAIVPQDNKPAGADTGPDAISLVVPTTSAGSPANPGPPAIPAIPAWTLAAPAATPPGQAGITQISLQAGAVAAMVTAGLAVNSPISLNGATTATVAGFNAGGNTITLANPIRAPATFPAGTQIHLLQCITYQVIGYPLPDNNGVCLGSAPCLVRGVAGAGLNCNVAASPCLPVVDGILDLQLSYACDGCSVAVNGGVADKIIDDLDGSGGFSQGDFWTNTLWTTAPLSPNTIRLVQVNIVAKQTAADIGFGDGGNTPASLTSGPIVVSDHNPANDAGYNAVTYSQVRHRVLTRTVETRNMGL
jgi:type IV pilus assembly protein PilW